MRRWPPQKLRRPPCTWTRIRSPAGAALQAAAQADHQERVAHQMDHLAPADRTALQVRREAAAPAALDPGAAGMDLHLPPRHQSPSRQSRAHPPPTNQRLPALSSSIDSFLSSICRFIPALPPGAAAAPEALANEVAMAHLLSMRLARCRGRPTGLGCARWRRRSRGCGWRQLSRRRRHEGPSGRRGRHGSPPAGRRSPSRGWRRHCAPRRDRDRDGRRGHAKRPG